MNSPLPILKTFNAKELRSWLCTNHATEWLSEAVISPSRAWAIIHNPYIQDDEPVAAALFLDNELTAFTASFPDRINNKNYHWFSTLWCHPSQQGKGYGLLVVGSLFEIFGSDNCLDMWGAPETVGIFNYLGHSTSYFPEYRFAPKHIRRGSLKGEIAYIQNKIQHIAKKTSIPDTAPRQYTLKYVCHIDNNIYHFIQQYGINDLIPRTQEMLNWILSYHFRHRTPLITHELQSNAFDDRDSRYWMSGVIVTVNNETVGFYILRDGDSELSIKYLYYNPEYRNCVFHSIARHIVSLGNPAFTTRNRQLSDYISNLNLFDKKETINISFSHPSQFTITDTAISQAGDGDGFA